MSSFVPRFAVGSIAATGGALVVLSLSGLPALDAKLRVAAADSLPAPTTELVKEAPPWVSGGGCERSAPEPVRSDV